MEFWPEQTTKVLLANTYTLPTAQTVPATTPIALKSLTPTETISASPTISHSPSLPIIAGAQKLPPSQTTASLLSRLPGDVTLMLLSMLLLALAFDFYFAYRLGAVRIVGRHAAHFIFLGFMMMSLFIISKGAIL